jgi:hypothetical protein
MRHLVRTPSIIPHLQINAIQNASHLWSTIPIISLMLVSIPTASLNFWSYLKYLPHCQTIQNTSPQNIIISDTSSKIPSSILSHHVVWIIQNTSPYFKVRSQLPHGYHISAPYCTCHVFSMAMTDPVTSPPTKPDHRSAVRSWSRL